MDFAVLGLQVIKANGIANIEQIRNFSLQLQKRYELDEHLTQSLIDVAKQAKLDTTDYSRFALNLKRHLNQQQRSDVIATLWNLSCTNEKQSELEINTIWRIANLLGISMQDIKGDTCNDSPLLMDQIPPIP
ncbi:TerB family tellurite resistance protein [Candidatus Liberibacter sp.]|uniref:tellurite resistance TerB family protein n=1 Tax=Candidatus Liberibacter sp. TaxID=34022 RepID=UPI0015F5114A|nr:TerB family tellurite resistance protein [Candidatus Liberibacter sp.]MBA5724155.1 TerB family tellurite resistance protein [Candidatus Liberibacter sp.]